LGLVVLKQSILISKNKIKKYGISILFVAILSFILRLTFSNSNSSNSLIMIYFFSIFINYIIIFNPKDVKIKPDNLTQYLQKNKSLIVSRSIQTFVNQTNYSGFILFLSKLCSIDEIAQIGIISTILMIPNMVFGKAGSDFYLSKYTKKNPNLIEWKRDILKFSLLSFLTMVAILLSPEKAFRFLFSDLGIGIKHYLIAFIPLYLGNLFNKPIMALVNVKGYDSVMLKWEIISTILKYLIILFLVNYLALNLYNIIFTFSILSLLSYIVLGFLVRKKEFDFEISSLR
jgi:hypothetical protein